MQRIDSTFAQLTKTQKKALVPFIAAGDPHPELTVPLLDTLVDAGADLLELGIPFSDPMAEGPPIQAAYERALSHGISLRNVLEMVSSFRQNNQHTPIILMGYLNPIEHMGYREFAQAANKAGVDGVIIVDLPAEESSELKAELQEAGLHLIFLLAPTTSVDRLQDITDRASGYIYYVSLKGVTGSSELDIDSVNDKMQQIKQYTKLPVTVGFGIKTPEIAAQVATVADGVVVGSALVDLVKNHLDNQPMIIQSINELVAKMRQQIDLNA